MGYEWDFMRYDDMNGISGAMKSGKFLHGYWSFQLGKSTH
jgi:hypothetical protein